MMYKIIGLMSGSSLDGVDIIYAHITEQGGKWLYEIKASDCLVYTPEYVVKLKAAKDLNAFDYFLLHKNLGIYLGDCINHFRHKNNLDFGIDFVVVHGHTVFHSPEFGFSTQLGCGANIAAKINLPVIDNLRLMDMAYGGQGAPIVPIGEKYLFPDEQLFINIGGILNISFHEKNTVVAFDICPANAVLNGLMQSIHLEMDRDGELGSKGKMNTALFDLLAQEKYFHTSYPKSLSNHLGFELLSLINSFKSISLEDKLCTYYFFIANEVHKSLLHLSEKEHVDINGKRLMLSGGGALNIYLVALLEKQLSDLGIQIILPNESIINFKEALMMCQIGVLRWREVANVLNSASGATRNSVNGSIWYANKLEH